jgi:hypothetical protein
MLARQAVLLNPLKSALPDCLPFYKQIAPVTPLESALTVPSQPIENIATLTFAESALTTIPSVTSLDSALTKKPGRVEGSLRPIRPYPFPIHQSEIWRPPLVYPDPVGATSRSPLFSTTCPLFCNFLLFFAPFPNPAPLFSIACALFCTFGGRGEGPPPAPPREPLPNCLAPSGKSFSASPL